MRYGGCATKIDSEIFDSLDECVFDIFMVLNIPWFCRKAMCQQPQSSITPVIDMESEAAHAKRAKVQRELAELFRGSETSKEEVEELLRLCVEDASTRKMFQDYLRKEFPTSLPEIVCDQQLEGLGDAAGFCLCFVPLSPKECTQAMEASATQL